MWTTDEEPRCKPLSNRDLYEKQMVLLKGFLEHGAISQEQYRVSADGLRQKMHFQPEE